MRRIRALSLTLVAAFLISIMIISLFLHYPLNLIVDVIAFAVVGVAFLIYIVIWSFLGDKVVVCRNHLTILTRRFPFWTTLERRIYFKEISHFVQHGPATILILKRGDFVHIDFSVNEEGGKIRDLPRVLEENGIRRMHYDDFIRKRTGKRKRYLSKI